VSAGGRRSLTTRGESGLSPRLLEMDGVDGPEGVVLGTNGGGMMESPLRFIMMTGFWVPSFDIRVATGVEFPEAAFGSPSSGERRTTVGAAPSGMGLGVLEVDDTKSW
jgi:hypothetical protein